MEWGRVADTELMPRLVVGYTELGGGKLKKGKRFLKPNFGMGANCDMISTVKLKGVFGNINAQYANSSHVDLPSRLKVLQALG